MNRIESRLEKPIFHKIGVIGAGLIGSSILRAVRKRGLADQIVVSDRDPKVCERVSELKLADQVLDDLAEVTADLDLLILCVPVGEYSKIAERILPKLCAGTIVSDVGSVKSSIFTAFAPFMRDDIHLIPAHPVAGTEYSGPDAGFATLFVNRWCILTPPEGADRAAIQLLKTFWEEMGANTEIMSAEHHDLVLAITSHVPHLIAYNIVGTAADLEEVTRSEVIKFSAGGFRDFTRIAASDPTMWRDVFLNNKTAVLEMLGRFSEDLTALQRMIRRGDGDGLFNLFTRTRAIRRSIIELGQETAAPDFGRQRILEDE